MGGFLSGLVGMVAGIGGRDGASRVLADAQFYLLQILDCISRL